MPILQTLPDFPEDAMFFVGRTYDGFEWRITRPAYTPLFNGQARSWDIWADGRIFAHKATYQKFCQANLMQVARDDALVRILSLVNGDMRLPEGF